MLDTLGLSKGRECQVLNSFSLPSWLKQQIKHLYETHFEPEFLIGKCQISLQMTLDCLTTWTSSDVTSLQVSYS